MNFLAHAYLSFNDPEILVGNMISDFVKGNKRYNYPVKIQQGIVLHRQIDAFTDLHEATKEARTYLKPAVGAYSGAFVDVAYDHFLANDGNEFSPGALQETATGTYEILNFYKTLLPPVFQQMLPYMQSQNWLYNYRNVSGTKNSFGGVARRAKYIDTAEPVFELFQMHYEALQKCYNAFFPFVKAFAVSQIEQLSK